jgi:polyisoprenoid-binding protein YceI
MKIIIFFCTLFSYFTPYTQQKFDLLVAESLIYWRGNPAYGFGGHEGTLTFSSGNIRVSKEGKIQGGSFIIDMNSIKDAGSKPEKGENNLEKHLKDDDFFAVKKYPQANFVITRIQPTSQVNKYSVTGNFTMRGITNQITFIALINVNKNLITAKADLSIFRSQWGITYKTDILSFLPNITNKVKNDLISDEIPLKLDLTFKKP